MAVDLEDPAGTGPLVEPIDVLGDHPLEKAPGLEGGEELVDGVGLGFAHVLKAPKPERIKSLGIAVETVDGGDLLRVMGAPKPLGAAEIGDPGGGGDPGTGEGPGITGFPQKPRGHTDLPWTKPHGKSLVSPGVFRNLVAQKGKAEYHFCAMAGHSKWANIKYRKEKQDKKRSNLFSRLTREIIVCARQDPNPETNPALAQAIERAKAANMPKENIERAIQRAAGGLEGTNLQEVIYEGYGPGGVAILLRAYTDNRNRTAAAVRHILERHGGSLGGEGSVAWQFERRGIIQIKSIPPGMDKETLVLLAAEAGAEDFAEEDETLIFYTQPRDLAEVRDALREKGVEIERAVIGFIPKTTVRVEGPEAEQLLKLLDELDETEEIQEVVANFDIPDEILAKVEGV